MARAEKEEAPVRAGYLIIDAWREEAQLFRYVGKEDAAVRLERMADRIERLVRMKGSK